ncbi:heterokaryon incompatibility protein-domain-containing protein [Hypoxylon argillaceum]|nr:heterokaryon incompatibility protein-domain-containing protein [Hypoxylon argillaceum]
MPKSTDNKTRRSHLCDPCRLTVTQLLQNASKQDNLLAWVARNIRDGPPAEDPKPIRYPGDPFSGGSCYICTRTRGLVRGFGIMFEYSITQRSVRVYQSHISRGFCFALQKSLDFTLSDQRLRFTVDAVSDRFWTPTNIVLARRWLQTCLTKHPECTREAKSTAPRELPARLIQVDVKHGAMRACLKKTSELLPTVRYLTLSHRWGDNKFILLNSRNLEQFLKGIPLDDPEFNRTFIDAMKITADLKYEYIWIDSLCIVQNDNADWEAECPRMGFIYLNGDCNLSANGVLGTKNALMCDRDPTIHTPVLFDTVPGVGSRYVVHIPGDTQSSQMHSKQIYEPPLFQRGWIVQEQVMAPRSLHFMEDKLAWVCSQFYGTELWPLGVPEGWIDWAHRNGKNIVRRLLAFDDKRISSIPAPSLDQVVQWGSPCRREPRELQLYPNLFEPNQMGWYILNWYWHIAGPYTATQLTKSGDVLPALSGMATIFQRKLGCRYYAGHWESGLLESLLWHMNRDGSPNTGLELPTKPEQSQDTRSYVAPTWSWASRKLNSTSKLDFPFLEPAQHRAYSPVSDVVDVSATATTSDRLGAVRDGYIVIRGPVSHFVVDEEDDLGYYYIRLFNKYPTRIKIYADDPSYLSYILRTYYPPQRTRSFPPSIPRNCEIFLLPLTWTPQIREVHGLILLRDQWRADSYVRAGKVLISPSEHYNTFTQIQTWWANEPQYFMRLL